MQHLQSVFLLFVVLGLVDECQQKYTYDVLALLPLVSPRNHKYDEAVLMALARRGHRVTVYSEFPPDVPHPRYLHVPLEKHPKPRYDYFEKRWSAWRELNYVKLTALNLERLYKTVRYVKKSLKFTSLQKKLKSGEKHYDVVVMEPLSGQEHLLLFAQWANASVAVLEPIGRNYDTDKEFLLEPSHHLHALKYYIDNISPTKPFDDLREKYINYLTNPEVRLAFSYDPSVERNLMHPIVTYTNDMVVKSVTYPTVRSSGIHINPSPTPLPEVTQAFLDSANEGVIVVDVLWAEPELSWPQQYRALGELPSSLSGFILWSSTHILLSSGPYEKTLPGTLQQILGHHKCKLLITDGNLLRIQEAIYYGVPVLAVPQTSFQNHTAAYLKALGMGMVVDTANIEDVGSPLNIVTRMTHNDWHKEKIAKASKEFRRTISGLEWTVHQSLVKALSGHVPTAEDASHLPCITPEVDAASTSMPATEHSSHERRFRSEVDAVADSSSTTEDA